MQRERITDHIFVFRSDLYAQVTAGVVITDEGAVLIDTLLYPEETRRIQRFVEEGLGSRVRYVINTHFHADHTTGTCFFPDAQVVSHRLCREMLDTRGRESLKRMQQDATEFGQVRLVLPNITFKELMTLRVGNTNFILRPSPGHSPDSITCLVEDAEVLFAADTVMPIPYFVDGSFADFEKSLARLLEDEYENVVQGHGDIVLRGEAPQKIKSDLEYLSRLDQAVKTALEQGVPDPDERIQLKDCGKSHVLLNGLVQQLHQHNVRALVKEYQDAGEQNLETDMPDNFEGSEEWQQKKRI